jgi:lipopolysaccharide/colanic/teichoic acid biosynthesis glycosyltransferase
MNLDLACLSHRSPVLILNSLDLPGAIAFNVWLNSRRTQHREGGSGQGTAMRRSGDVLIACVLLAITLPLLIITAAAIRFGSSGPILERRAHIGAGGRQFQVLSFRTTAWRPGQFRPIWQITPLGQFLQSTRIDALPQLFNVLRGDMSITDTALFE